MFKDVNFRVYAKQDRKHLKCRAKIFKLRFIMRYCLKSDIQQKSGTSLTTRVEISPTRHGHVTFLSLEHV